MDKQGAQMKTPEQVYERNSEKPDEEEEVGDEKQGSGEGRGGS